MGFKPAKRTSLAATVAAMIYVPSAKPSSDQPNTAELNSNTTARDFATTSTTATNTLSPSPSAPKALPAAASRPTEKRKYKQKELELSDTSSDLDDESPGGGKRQRSSRRRPKWLEEFDTTSEEEVPYATGQSNQNPMGISGRAIKPIIALEDQAAPVGPSHSTMRRQQKQPTDTNTKMLMVPSALDYKVDISAGDGMRTGNWNDDETTRLAGGIHMLRTDWKEIAMKYVKTRTPAQCKSKNQKMVQLHGVDWFKRKIPANSDENRALANSKKKRALPLGVSESHPGRFTARTRCSGTKNTQEYIGAFDTPEQASNAYTLVNNELDKNRSLSAKELDAVFAGTKARALKAAGEQVARKKGGLPRGVNQTFSGRFVASAQYSGVKNPGGYIGVFDTPEQASAAYTLVRDELEKSLSQCR